MVKSKKSKIQIIGITDSNFMYLAFSLQKHHISFYVHLSPNNLICFILSTLHQFEAIYIRSIFEALYIFCDCFVLCCVFFAAAPPFFGLLIPFAVGVCASLLFAGFLLVGCSSPLVDMEASDPLSLSTFQAPWMWLSRSKPWVWLWRWPRIWRWG